MTALVSTAAVAGDGGEPAVFFDAILHPNRSLGRRGFAILMAVFAAASLTVGGVFLIAGAWPVFGLYGLDLAVLYWAFRINYRGGRRFEKVRLTADRLTVERCDPSGRRSTWSFQPHWLRVTVDDRPGRHSRLILSSHGRSLVVGSFLAPEERREFADALRAALGRAKAPSAYPA